MSSLERKLDELLNSFENSGAAKKLDEKVSGEANKIEGDDEGAGKKKDA